MPQGRGGPSFIHPVNFSLMRIKAPVGFSIGLPCGVGCCFCFICIPLIDGLLPHFSVSAEFSLSSWDATVDRARTHSPLWPACWLQVPDRSRSSSSSEVRDIWDVYIREVGFVPLAVRDGAFSSL